MRLEPLASDDPRDVLRALRGAVLGAGPAIALGEAPALPDEVPAGTAVVLTTSGSTGVPKSVVLSRSALTSSALATAARIGEGHWLLSLSGGYVAGVQVMVRALVAGRDPAILAGRFTPRAFAHAVSGMHSMAGGERVPTYTSLVPAQLQTLLDAADDPDVLRALRSFETILIGGQALPVPVRERAAELGVRIVRTYGSTETSGGCVYDGVPLDGVRVEAAGGELRIAGPNLADGYLGDPDRTAQTFVTDPAGVRWYRTGDAGTVTDGVVAVTGRIDNVIISGGVNVSLDRVERVVQSVPGLEVAVVVGAPHERWGQTPVIALAGSADAALLAAARAAVEAELGKPARPDRIVPLATVPRLASGKPDRRAITALVTRG
ncbi:AMP-binding protein [Microbacterium sediminis]|uniref:Acyl-CoA synthetase n=1 Tax=Microbacterium sediminis TaxID=904291 RepID=A0A1B9NDD6_9MICO|nr:AMP-binding protein [Microbacterium sediminis]OCG74564.1 acyl-CoA synthetase [Microbacterium sediminis]QBR74863.1 acyl-CoA synthetase [Microbacterium sediminis]